MTSKKAAFFLCHSGQKAAFDQIQQNKSRTGFPMRLFISILIVNYQFSIDN